MIANKVFESWYAPGGQGSGDGSTAAYTSSWRAFIQDFMRQNNVRSVLDFGCGDWQFSKLIDWGDRVYFGVDVVGGLIHRLRKEHGGPNRFFQEIDPLAPSLPGPVDLLIVKDVLQHLSNADILQLLPRFKVARHWLLVNDKSAGGKNPDTKTGGYRWLDMSAPPFSLQGTDAFKLPPPWPKTAFWVRNEP